MKKTVVAFDFGASSGRAIAGTYQDGRLEYKEVHRFDNIPVDDDGRMCHNFPAICKEVDAALSKINSADGLSFDTWGVDYGLLDKSGNLLRLPCHYRDTRTAGTVEKVLKKIPADNLYRATGNQIMEINTLFQLTTEDTAGAEKLLGQGDMLFMPVGAPKPVRIQGTFVRDEEISRVLDFIKSSATVQYDEAMIEAMEKHAIQDGKKGSSSADSDEEGGSDPMLKQAVEVVIDAGQASTSLLQRRCKLGYARAARIMTAKRYRVRLEYPQLARFQQILAQLGGSQEDESYAVNVELTAVVPQDDCARFEERVREAFNAAVVPAPIDMVNIPVPLA